MVQSLERAFAILQAVAARPAGVTALAEEVGLPKSTVARLLTSLEKLGAVERGERATWILGPAIAALSRATSPERALIAAARPELVRLVEALGEAAGLSLPDGHEVRYVDQAESDHPVQVRDWTGTRAPMHAVPSGLVLLAEWPPEALDAYLEHPLVALTSRTVTDPAALRGRLAEVRAQGFAWCYEEYAEGINSVAAPVRDGRGKAIAAVHVHGPSYRFPGQRRCEAEAAVVEAAAVVSRRLGR